MTRLLRLGFGAGLVGVAAGVLIAMLALKDVADIWEIGSYSHAMLGPFALGTIAIAAALTELVRSGHSRGPSIVIAWGAAAIAAPFTAALLIALYVLVSMVIVVAYYAVAAP